MKMNRLFQNKKLEVEILVTSSFFSTEIVTKHIILSLLAHCREARVYHSGWVWHSGLRVRPSARI